MGSWLSGSGRGAPKDQQFWRLAIADLKLFGYLRGLKSGTFQWARNGQTVASMGVTSFGAGIILKYAVRTNGDAPEQIEETIDFDFTDVHFGGQRAWFLCPGCGGRCSVLYGARRYKCRKCWRMTYASQYRDELDRVSERMDRRRVRLGGEGGALNPLPSKPKRMRWATFDRMLEDDRRDEERLLRGFARKFKLPL